MDHNLLTLEFVERIIDQPVIYFPRGYNLVDEVAGDQLALSALSGRRCFTISVASACRSPCGTRRRT